MDVQHLRELLVLGRRVVGQRERLVALHAEALELVPPEGAGRVDAQALARFQQERKIVARCWPS